MCIVYLVNEVRPSPWMCHRWYVFLRFLVSITLSVSNSSDIFLCLMNSLSSYTLSPTVAYIVESKATMTRHSVLFLKQTRLPVENHIK